MRRKWIKMWVNKLFEFYEEVQSDTARALFWGLIAIAGDGTNPGLVCFNKNIGYTLDQISSKITIPKDSLEGGLKILVHAKVIKIQKNNIIKILHWEKYQSEYERQKPYRQAKKEQKLLSEVISESYRESSTVEEEVRSKKKEVRSKKEINNIIDRWNIFCENLEDIKKIKLSKAVKLTPIRERHIVARLNEKEFDISKILQYIENSDFLLGLVKSKDRKTFKVDFDWILNPNNYIKILEGKYDNKSKSNKKLSF